MPAYNEAMNLPRVVPEVLAVLHSAARVYRESAGAFDPTVGALDGWHFEPGQQAVPTPAAIAQALRRVDGQALRLDAQAGTAYLARPGMALDLGGIAKLPILAAGLRVLQHEGVENALLNGGGDVLTAGLLLAAGSGVAEGSSVASGELVGSAAETVCLGV